MDCYTGMAEYPIEPTVSTEVTTLCHTIPRHVRHPDTPIRLRPRETVTKNSRNFATEVLNCRGSVENGNFRAIDAPFARLQHDQLAGRLHRIATEAVGTGFDAHRILTFGHHPPLDVARHDALIIADRYTNSEPRIDDGDMHAAFRVGRHFVREGLLREVRLRRNEGRPALGSSRSAVPKSSFGRAAPGAISSAPASTSGKPMLK